MVNELSKRHAPIARCVAGILIRDGKALLVKRSPQSRYYPGVWDLFGGHIEAGETYRGCVAARGSGGAPSGDRVFPVAWHDP